MAGDRDALNRGERTFADLLARHGLMLPAREIVYFDHWITPPIRARRFDTRFFVARAPHGQEGSHDNGESVHSVWLRPVEALERAERGEIEIAFATGFVLREFARFATVDEALAHANAKGPIETNRPAVAQGSAGPRIFRRDDAAYAEIHWSDPEETTQTTYDLVPGVPKRLDRFVTRIIAPNPGKMTGPGTNTYLVGDDEQLAVIDPGPLIDSHIAAIVACGRGRIRWLLCTHTHRDHSPAARALQATTGARVIGYPAPAGESQDGSFAPDWLPAHDERLPIAGLTLRALHTPGHASNHLCFLLEETKMLFTGDHVMQGSTVIINPPDGDMRAYLRSLESLLAQDIAIIAPGHGYLIGPPHREIRRLDPAPAVARVAGDRSARTKQRRNVRRIGAGGVCRRARPAAFHRGTLAARAPAQARLRAAGDGIRGTILQAPGVTTRITPASITPASGCRISAASAKMRRSLQARSSAG